jgi:hypothetical protein
VIELVTVTAVLGVLVSIAIPKYQQVRKRANAADIIGAMTAIRAGAYQYYETAAAWPATAPNGTVPTGLGPYLAGGGLSLFRGPFHRMRWVVQRSGRANQAQLIQATITDGVVCQSVSSLLGGTRNRALTTACGRARGTVSLFVDR